MLFSEFQFNFNHFKVTGLNLIAKFKGLDSNKNGTIEIAEIQKMLRENGISQDQAQEIFKNIDINGDGHISLDEFLKRYNDAYKNISKT